MEMKPPFLWQSCRFLHEMVNCTWWSVPLQIRMYHPGHVQVDFSGRTGSLKMVQDLNWCTRYLFAVYASFTELTLLSRLKLMTFRWL